jgi:hypothetical protein
MEKSRYQRKSSLGLEFLGIIAVYMSELHPSVSGDTPDTPGAKVYEPQLKQRQEFLKCFDLHEKTESMTVQSLRILLTEDKITDVRNEMKCLDVKTYKKFEPLYEPGNLFNLLNKNIKYLKDCVRSTESENDKISIIVMTNKVRQEINEHKLSTLLTRRQMYTSSALDRCTNLESPPEVPSKLS